MFALLLLLQTRRCGESQDGNVGESSSPVASGIGKAKGREAMSFQSFTSKYLDFDKAKQEWRWEITIVDDDFEETAAASASAAAEAATALIDIYSRRHLPVAKNLWRLQHYLCAQHSWLTIQVLHEWWLEYVPAYKEYVPELEYYWCFS